MRHNDYCPNCHKRLAFGIGIPQRYYPVVERGKVVAGCGDATDRSLVAKRPLCFPASRRLREALLANSSTGLSLQIAPNNAQGTEPSTQQQNRCAAIRNGPAMRRYGLLLNLV